VFNSVKGWDYTKSWFIEQNAKWKEQIGCVVFQENYDTQWLMGEVRDNLTPCAKGYFSQR